MGFRWVWLSAGVVSLFGCSKKPSAGVPPTAKSSAAKLHATASASAAVTKPSVAAPAPERAAGTEATLIGPDCNAVFPLTKG